MTLRLRKYTTCCNNEDALLAGSRTFGAISTGERVLIGGALTLARGGSFEDGVLTTVGSIVGQEVGETAAQGLNQAFDGAISLPTATASSLRKGRMSRRRKLSG
jgi:hypothetical protein